MKLRSGTILPALQQFVYTPTPSKNIQEFTPQFFDDASKAWRKNKVETGQGMYKYKNVVENIVRRSPRVAPQPMELRRSERLAMK
jgi:hypothetical protein